MPVRRTIRRYAPERVVMWYRRRRELRIYFHELGDNLWLQRLRTLDLQKRGEPVTAEEMVMEGGTGAWLAWAVHDIVERNDIVLKAMERKIEALTARHGQQIRNLRDEVATIQGRLVELEGQLTELNGPAAGAGTPELAANADGAGMIGLDATADGAGKVDGGGKAAGGGAGTTDPPAPAEAQPAAAQAE